MTNALTMGRDSAVKCNLRLWNDPKMGSDLDIGNDLEMESDSEMGSEKAKRVIARRKWLNIGRDLKIRSYFEVGSNMRMWNWYWEMTRRSVATVELEFLNQTPGKLSSLRKREVPERILEFEFREENVICTRYVWCAKWNFVDELVSLEIQYSYTFY